jgi:hypothetical protein
MFINGGADHPLRRLLVVLATMNSTKMVREFDMVGNYDLKPGRSVYDYLLEALLHVPNVNDVLERELTSVGRDFYQMVVPWLVASETSGFDSSLIFFSDGSKGEAVPVLVYIVLMVLSPAFVLGNQLVKWSVCFGDVGDFEALILDRYLIVTDSMDSLKAL